MSEQVNPFIQERIDSWQKSLTYINGEITAYERLKERNELSDIAMEEYEDLQTLRNAHRRWLGMEEIE